MSKATKIVVTYSRGIQMSPFEPVRISATAEADLVPSEKVDVETKLLLEKVQKVVESEIAQKRKERKVGIEKFEDDMQDDVYDH